ncbi:MAG: DUF1700 domain-containing protein [Clostridia bacterium]|nr:DUF1700 domain-containing protein [Clostridia bacterium]
MSRQEFILALRSELKKLPPEEIVAATEFFEEYFDDVLASGEKTESEIVNELGSPKKVAAEIKADYAARILEGDETVLDKKPSAGKKISAVWWVVLGIISAPVSIPLACCIAFVAICIFFGLLGIMIFIYATIIGCACGAIGTVVFGIIAFGSSLATGFMFVGIGLLLAAMTAAAGVGAYIGTRELIKLIVRLIRDKHIKNKNKRLQEMSSNTGEEWVYVERGEMNE